MIVKNIIDEDFVNYKKPSMFIGAHSCSFKCNKESGCNICQNSDLANSPDVCIDNYSIIQRYLKNPITKAIVFGGLEPLDSISDVFNIITMLRMHYCMDDVVIYTGYTEQEFTDKFSLYDSYFRTVGNVIVKFGRFKPNQERHFDEVLGVFLFGDNQYAKRL